ncbi:MAG: hypothetical protein A2017_08760 [Lentisphaerae bacterium GWF2_44_16]|nr:MAG: hypothetical protein A2017_08760 [Lentisphaerae bacterium GWF2_44_16]
MQDLSDQEFMLLSDFIYHTCGIVVREDKKYLITQRLGPLAQQAGCKTFGDYYRKLKEEEANEQNRLKIIEAITTNETSFFRDEHPFEAIRSNILPSLFDTLKKQKTQGPFQNLKLRIWSAASSTGQEPYTLAIIVRELLQNCVGNSISSSDIRILATDISCAVLARAISGKYNEIEISRGLNDEHKKKYFRKEGTQWHIIDSIKEMVEFRQVNLVKPFSAIGTFEFIVCRNVLIYFDDKTKSRILNQFYDMLTPGGFLVLGAMENTYCLTDKFSSLRFGKTIVYAKQ